METTVKMTEAERLEFEAFKETKQKQAAAEKAKQDRETYKSLVDETINSVFPDLGTISQALSLKKKEVYEAFQKALVLKSEIFENKTETRSNTFTNKEGSRRITLGQYETDAYDDTVNEGIAKVKAFISSLAKDSESTMLVDAIMRLLAKDQKGNLKASRVMQLRKMSQESGNEEFIDGVKIIEDAYRPEVSKFYIKAEYKNEQGAWVSLPLGITEA